jgi:hypothetical protein
MKFLRLLPLLFILQLSTTIAQTGPDSNRDDSYRDDSNRECHLRISLLTCSPGEELYSTFGHTAIRVTDSTTGIDMVYNYGTFDDRDPNFYVKFTKGIMIYALSNYSYQDFLLEYSSERRGVIEQTLNLTCAEKQRLYAALQQNALEENRYYNYYFHTDNCTTRARDMVAQKTGAVVQFKNILPAEPPTFRQLIHTYLDKGGQHWSKLGIDLLLGSNLDKEVTNEQSMFLPDYLMKGFDNGTADQRKLVKQTQVVLPVTAPLVQQTLSLTTPVFILSALFIVIGLLSFSTNKWSQRVLNVFDSIFFLFIGILGIVCVTLWLIRVDTVCRNNFNIWWALPTHFLIAFVVYLKRKWIQQYFRIVFVLTALFAVCWWMLPQQFNAAVFPVLGIILIRTYFRGNLNRAKFVQSASRLRSKDGLPEKLRT